MQPRKEQLAERAKDMGETPDQTPVEVPGSMLTPPSLEERIKMFVRGELSRAAVGGGVTGEPEGSFSEEDDFEEDDFEGAVISDYQFVEMTRDLLDDVRGQPMGDYSVEENAAPQDAQAASAGDIPATDTPEVDSEQTEPR